MIQQGQVIKLISGFYDVESENKIYRLRASGTLRDLGVNPVVGDYVKFRDEKVLIEILPRTKFLIRPKVANVDQVVLVFSLDKPKFSSLLLDRFLIMIEFQKIKPIILFTKADIGSHKPYFDYKSQNYNCYMIDNKINIDEDQYLPIKNELKNKLSVFSGQSGVGKSTTINKILNLNLLTNEISEALGRGKHTTRAVEIFHKGDYKIIDTPGFGSIQISLTKQEVSTAYADFEKWSKECKFRSCLHYKEIDCNVKKQLENGRLLQSRYDNYIKILLECE